MPTDPPPELATNADWRKIMVAARKDAEMTQKELGSKVGTSQNVISLIESGEVSSSTFVLPICAVLGIPPPVHFDSDDQRLWWQLGHVLRTKNMKQFRRTLELVKSMVDDEESEAVTPASLDAPESRPPRK